MNKKKTDTITNTIPHHQRRVDTYSTGTAEIQTMEFFMQRTTVSIHMYVEGEREKKTGYN